MATERARIGAGPRSWVGILLPEELVLAAALLVAAAACVSTGTGFTTLSLVAGYAGLFGQNLLIVIVASRFLVMVRRPEGGAHIDLRRDLALLRCVAFLFVYVLVYTNVKVRIPILHAGNADALLAELDHSLSFGADPVRLAHGLAHHEWLVAVLARVYRHNYLLMTITCLLLYAYRDPKHMRHLFATMALVYLVGVLVAVALPSQGPCFVSRSAFLWMREGPAREIWKLQELLLRQASLLTTARAAGHIHDAAAFSGIAAFPSLHVAHCFVLVSFAWTHHRWLLAAYVPITSLVVLATLVFGWHYAVDALAALPLVAAARLLAGRLVLGDWWEPGRFRTVGLVAIPLVLLGAAAIAADPKPIAQRRLAVLDDDDVTGHMVSVPAGGFLMGCRGRTDPDCGLDEAPLRTVWLPAFEVDRTEVTRRAYQACVDARVCELETTGLSVRRAEYPVVNVTHSQAETFCKWASKRLPTEAEWERAARGADGRRYPWGDAAPSCSMAAFAGCVGGPLPVGSFPAAASPCGALDMAGNVWEWVADWYAPYAGTPTRAPRGAAVGSVRVFRGGSFAVFAADLRTSNRAFFAPTYHDRNIGFRCARGDG